jgi:ABC-type uncharacterized transport system permease subunit
MSTTLIAASAIALYLVTSALLGLRLLRGAGGAAAVVKPALLALGLGAVALHGGLLQQALFTPAGLNLGFFNAFSLTGWLIALLLLLSAFTRPVENLGIALLPLAALALALAGLFPSQHLLAVSGPWPLKAHIVLSLTAYSALGIAAVQALLLAVQDRHLRNRQPGGFIRALPPLATMETLLFQMIGAGFVLLTLALLSGFIFLEDLFAQHLAHKTVLSIIAWLVFAALLWGRWRSGWRGRTAIRWTLAGFVALMLAYFGSKLVLELILT